MKRLKNMKKSTVDSLITYALVIVLFALFQTLSSGGHLTRSLTGQLVPVCVYAAAAVALNLVVGFSGDLSLGHAGFLSIGAFSGVVFCHLFSFVGNDTLRLLLSMLCGGVTAGVFGALIGIPVLRLRGDYLAIVTLAFGQIIKNIAECIYLGYDTQGWHFSFGRSLSMEEGATVVLNGPMGVTGNAKLSTFAVGFVLLMVTLFVAYNMINSRTGRAIMAVRDNRIAAESVGISAGHFKMTAFVTSAFLTGMAGTLYVMNYASVAPAKFDFNTSILILVFVVMGGMGNIRGSVIAAIILTILPERLRAVGEYRMLIYAVLLILMMLATRSEKGKAILAKTLEPFKRLLRRGGTEKKPLEAAGEEE